MPYLVVSVVVDSVKVADTRRLALLIVVAVAKSAAVEVARERELLVATVPLNPVQHFEYGDEPGMRAENGVNRPAMV